MTAVSLSNLERQIIAAHAFEGLAPADQAALAELEAPARNELFDRWRPSWPQITEALNANPLVAFVSAVHEVRPDLVVRAVFGAEDGFVEVHRSAGEVVKVTGFDRKGRGEALRVVTPNTASDWSGDAKDADELGRSLAGAMTPSAQVDPESKRVERPAEEL